ncbi:lipoprotein [Bradyrhizobium sp. URHD0069]|uniref:lipoprotein n=1 Tax=Bradyrhizobium sp. URHD0069 TaxID=1380355 RepID=UPI0012DFB89D|nr:lipoprotein [Bradyrhizobium sp. URHD0069]
MRKPLAAAVAFLLLAGCQTGAEYQAKVESERAARLQTHVGRSMADFSRDTGMVPSSMYDVSTGRVFVVDGPAVTLALAPNGFTPGVARTFACRIQLETVSMNRTGDAHDWRITGVNSTGPC